MRSDYLALLRRPGMPELVLGSIVARIPIPMFPLASVLLIHDVTGSFAAAGLVGAAYAASTAIFAPLLGRIVDRRGQTKVVLVSAAISGAAFAALVIGARAGVATVGLCAIAAAAGAAEPPIAGCMRTLWPSLTAGSQITLSSAFALDSVIVEACYIGGPLLAGVLIAIASPGTALFVAGALTVVGGAIFAASEPSRRWRPTTHRRGSSQSALRVPAFRLLVANLSISRVGMGLLNVAVAGAAVRSGSPGSVGLLFAAQGVGSGIGGLGYGLRRWRSPPVTRYAAFTGLLAVGLLPLALVPSIPLLCLLMGIGGLALAPSVASSFETLDAMTPGAGKTEAYSWSHTGAVSGDAVGSAAAGPIVQDLGPWVAFLLASACVGASAAVAATVLPRWMRTSRARAFTQASVERS
jgi:MFS family permease